jgi:hypothetical protein
LTILFSFLPKSNTKAIKMELSRCLEPSYRVRTRSARDFAHRRITVRSLGRYARFARMSSAASSKIGGSDVRLIFSYAIE